VASAATVSAVSPLGVYGGEDPSTEQALAQSIGRQPGYAMAFLDGSSFQRMEDPSWFISQFQGSSYSMIWGVSAFKYSRSSTGWRSSYPAPQRSSNPAPLRRGIHHSGSLLH
jgi:hypothetical protein